MPADREHCHLVDNATQELVAWAQVVRAQAGSPFAMAQQLVRRLGCHYRDGRAEAGFWAPEVVEGQVPASEIWLELLTPREPIDFQLASQTLDFRRQRVPLVLDGEYLWGVIEGLPAGSRQQVGTLYWVRYRDDAGTWHTIHDPLAYSVPFGAFAPAELYDLERLDRERADRGYFSRLDGQPDPDGVHRIGPPANILQIHPHTASAPGTLAGLADLYRTISHKLRSGQPLTPAEENYIGYDAVQLMPIEPTIVYEVGPPFWEMEDDDPTANEVRVVLRRPDTSNWGYDIVISASPAVNPTVLGSRRPDELVDLIATLHNFPDKPIKVLFDIVYGHADNQALPLLNGHFFAGSGMYGQEMNFRHPVVRAILLEMQRRKSNYGVDGLRVDGAQDFKYWDREAQVPRHDDDFLALMNDVEQDVAGQRYRPWMIFEDGRPWPRDDWELASTYREVTNQHPNVWQWGPLTFAHNTPFLFTFWISKRWRLEELTEVGGKWITGCANHDTLRRGTQVDPTSRINTYLGDTLPQVFKNAYDNPAAKLLDYACLPGIPMDFLNALMRAPWSFIRNTDDRYSVKIVSEEKHFLDWIVDEAQFRPDDAFPRLKALGFDTLGELRRFLHSLDHAGRISDYDLAATVKVLQCVDPALAGPPLTAAGLKVLARAWMDDVREACNVSRYVDQQEVERTRFNLAAREFRRKRPWLMDDLRPGDHFDHHHPCDGTVLFYGLRRAPDASEQVLFVANMEGAPRAVRPVSLPIPGLPRDGWQMALSAPGLHTPEADQETTLHDSQGAVFVRRQG
jgi:hypothetical protein